MPKEVSEENVSGEVEEEVADPDELFAELDSGDEY
jgi:hypothetical protein